MHRTSEIHDGRFFGDLPDLQSQCPVFFFQLNSISCVLHGAGFLLADKTVRDQSFEEKTHHNLVMKRQAVEFGFERTQAAAVRSSQ